MIGCTHDLLYNLRVAENIWSLSLKHDFQTSFVTLTGADAACLFDFLNGITGRCDSIGNEQQFMSIAVFTRSSHMVSGEPNMHTLTIHSLATDAVHDQRQQPQNTDNKIHPFHVNQCISSSQWHEVLSGEVQPD